MSAEPRIKGWCPGAWQPMATGDGLLVRVRPRLGQLERGQVLALCEAAEAYGSGLIELTSRANLQLRGVTEASWPALMETLVAHDLIDADPEAERRPQILLAPGWQAGDDTHKIASALNDRWQELPVVPAKVGIAIDAGKAPVLGEASADFRIERAESGGLLVRADGHALGTAVPSIDDAVAQLIRLLAWFVESGGWDSKRMRRHHVPLPDWAPANARPAATGSQLPLGKHEHGAVYGLPFGRVPARVLRAAVMPADVNALQVTPWRRIWIAGASAETIDGLISDEQDVRLRIDACPGAPYCEQASVATQPLAERLRGVTQGAVHVSGCAKGCARRSPADVCVVGQAGRFDLIINGRADSTPVKTNLTETEVIAYLESLGAPHL
ncbi:cobalamin biosynthesis protein CobG [Halomonas sp. Mc5H-6]|uniref:cobalamin biosynthesis protein CobG n=1 Tax=Halomonas sp. Mc5H-6 TaxID=2954500 RepID=UPI002098118E|nr:cobalamin biosynthesis protein CobG [Halomonas sp. Mc5H-6]MCO7246925.1 cobalamin biosynthesis protein CobG [Halomonas sp. Mc5H-6]